MIKLKITLVFIFITIFLTNLNAQNKLSDFERDRNRQMLRAIKDELVNNYYDPKFHGVDVEQNYKKADEILKKVGTNSEAFYVMAAFLTALKDSHTFFSPPSRNAKIEHGWTMQMIGDKCFVASVQPGSIAEKQGLKEGDQLLGIEGFAPTRESFWQMKYLFYALNPVSEFKLIIQTPDGQQREQEITAKRTEERRITDLTSYSEYMKMVQQSENAERINSHRFAEFGDDLIIWKMPEFDLTINKIDDIMNKVSKKNALILDLRGNGGGYEETLLWLMGYFIEKDLKVGDLIRRKETKTMTAKPHSGKIYKGKLIILVDSDSASSAEIFPRVMQIEKRATIIGDKTAGAVMRAIFHPKEIGLGTVVFYGVNITDADLIMTDGKSLEKTGVTPDELLLPTASDMAAKRDSVLAHAVALAGVQITPEKAGSLFPVIWK